jgi:hypothetical protein
MEIFLHVAVMNNWEQVVAELLDPLHGRQVNVGLAGDEGRARLVLDRLCAARRIGWKVVADEPLDRFEIPTMEAAQNSAAPVVVYAHTKGVSQPSPFNDGWRRLMTRHVLGNLDRNRKVLEAADHNCLGVAGFVDWFQSYRDAPGRRVTYFAGNFWMAKASYLKTLPPIREYWDKTYGRSRYTSELWIGRNETYRPLFLDGLFFDQLGNLGAYLHSFSQAGPTPASR